MRSTSAAGSTSASCTGQRYKPGCLSAYTVHVTVSPGMSVSRMPSDIHWSCVMGTTPSNSQPKSTCKPWCSQMSEIVPVSVCPGESVDIGTRPSASHA
eukprot:355797-Chlamydomonas_euryale.AAC.10